MTRILLVRHGETQWNEVGRFQGSTAHTVLSPRGKRQAEALARTIGPQRPAAVYSSPLMRAFETAQTIAQPLRLEPKCVADLREMELGELEGLLHEEAEARFGEVMARWRRDPSSVTMPGGESLAELQGRAWAAVDAVSKAHADETVVVVSHSFTIQSIVCRILEVPLSKFRSLRLDLGSISVVEMRDGTSRLLSLNDRCHIPPEDLGTGH